MTQKIVINGVSYDSPDAMPPDVRQKYDQALAMMKGAGPGAHKIEIRDRQVNVTINGKTYDNIEDLPPLLRKMVDGVLSKGQLGEGDQSHTNVQVVNLDKAPDERRPIPLLGWLVVIVVVILAYSFLLK